MENDSFTGMIKHVFKNGLNKQTLGLAIIAPLIIMIIVGYMVTMVGTQDPVKIGVVNYDKGLGNFSASSSIIEELKNQENVSVVYISQDQITGDLNDKTISAALVFPENFTTDLTRKNAQLNMTLEGTDQTMNILDSKAVSTSVTAVAAKTANITQPLTVNVNDLYGTGLDFTDLILYRFMVLITLVLSLIIALVRVLQDKKTGLFSRMAVSPVKGVIAYILGLCIFGFLIIPIVLAFLIFIMGATIVGSLTSVVLVMLLISLVGTSLGVLFTSITQTRNQAFGLFAVVLILQVVFSGLFIPVSRFDQYTQLVSYSLPFTYALDAMKSITIKGFSLADVGTDLVALLVILAVAVIVSMAGLKLVQKSGDDQRNDQKV
ncbi:ABC transporter permease [Methanobacterium formicicum]|uniref:ABC-2 type transporter n=1 Tax=Methanobacterium formicicum (strain DSM 3637 / PP1) TaxID=1204725 RepID=K2R4V9_METFP|nr:ABC transporter permease [Methanobacterium formicicum]EKF86242.1 ABC-2 type transporter [Methanobacterium formicicum DSM 3637]